MRISSAQYRHIRIKYARHARGRGCVRAKYKRRAREAKRRAGTNKGRSHCSCRIARRHGQKRNAAPKTSKAIPVERNAAYRTKYPQERLMAVTQPALTRMSKQCPATRRGARGRSATHRSPERQNKSPATTNVAGLAICQTTAEGLQRFAPQAFIASYCSYTGVADSS